MKDPRFILSRGSYYFDFSSTPCAVMVATALQAFYGFNLVFAHSIIAGYLLWTLLEYLIHRFLFHRLYRREHWAHHTDPQAYVGVSPWLTSLSFGAAWIALVLVFGTSIGNGTFVGLLVGYFSYIYVHDRIHHDITIDIPSVSIWHGSWKRHRLHHRGVEGNFGVVHPLVDILFGTHYRV